MQKFVSQTEERDTKETKEKSAAEILKDVDNGSRYGCTSCLSVGGGDENKKGQKQQKHSWLLTGEIVDLL